MARTRALTRAEIGDLARRIAELLADPDADLSRNTRLRWEGALTALEIVLGRAPSLPPDDVATEIGSLL